METFETLVCEIYKDSSNHQRRVGFREKTLKGDVDAAAALIALDGDFERDWWNRGPHRGYLKADLPLLQKLPDGPRVNAARCAGECLMLEEPSKEAITAILLRHGLLTDPEKTVPTDGALASLIFGLALQTEVLTRGEARQKFTEKLLVMGKSAKNADLLNIVANLNSETSAMGDIEQQAWEATDDPRFAGGYLTYLAKEKELKTDHALLLKALRQFPEDCWIWRIAVALEKEPREDVLVRAIKAEYRHFSPSGMIMLRPSAKVLRFYMGKLTAVAR